MYSRQKKLYTEAWKVAALTVTAKESELRKEVTQSCYALGYSSEKAKLLKRSDSLFAQFAKKATLRFQQGESNILEKTTAETQQGNIQSQLIQLQQEKAMMQSQFQLLLNDTNAIIPATTQLKLPLLIAVDSTTIGQHPAAQILE